MIYINITNFVLISSLKKDHSMIKTRRLKNVIFFQIILSFRAVKKNNNENVLSILWVKNGKMLAVDRGVQCDAKNTLKIREISVYFSIY